MTLVPFPIAKAEQHAQLATDELIATAQALIHFEAPTLSPEVIHEWLDSSEELSVFTTNGGISKV